jgi:CheY-like chemotaxis protein
VQPSADTAAPEARVYLPSSGHVLVAEDNLMQQKLIELQLAKLGLSVDIVSNGRQAVELAAQGAYSLIFMDLEMPEMDGLEATRAIRQMESITLRRVPIIAVTARTLKCDRDVCLSAGMDDYVSKPFTLDRLRAVLARWLLQTNQL